MTARLIDPIRQLERGADESLGYVSQSGILDRVRLNTRVDADPERNTFLLSQETITGHRANPAAGASTEMLIVVPTSSTAFDSLARAIYVPDQARVLLVRITANANVTAGAAMPELEITEGADVTVLAFDEAALDTTYPFSKAAKYDWPVAPQIAGGATVKMRVKTDSAYLPITNDFTITWTLGYSEWI